MKGGIGPCPPKKKRKQPFLLDSCLYCRFKLLYWATCSVSGESLQGFLSLFVSMEQPRHVCVLKRDAAPPSSPFGFEAEEEAREKGAERRALEREHCTQFNFKSLDRWTSGEPSSCIPGQSCAGYPTSLYRPRPDKVYRAKAKRRGSPSLLPNLKPKGGRGGQAGNQKIPARGRTVDR